MNLEKLEPKKVFEYFQEISKIPHGSYNIDAISDWLVNFAKMHSLDYVKDDAKNVIIRREASKGYENVPVIMLQGHMDMVCAKENNLEFDFLKDELDLYIDGDFLKARGTTLGADDGIFVAYALALLTEPELEIGKIEAVFTVNEEVGLLGAFAIDEKNLSGKYMINIDSGEEDSITVGCAGGQDAEVYFDIENSSCILPAYILEVGGLNGGHSGEQINQGLANSNKVLFEVLDFIKNDVELRISDIEGGVADNVIPSYSKAILHLNDTEFELVKEKISDILSEYKEQYKLTDGNITISINKADIKSETIIDEKSIENIIKFAIKVPNGVIKMSNDIEGLVETSLNMGIVSLKESAVCFTFSIRSSIQDSKMLVLNELNDIANECQAVLKDLGGYPGWEFNKESKLRPLFKRLYRETYNKELEIKAIHAGLECGIFAGKIKDLDCVSMGPNVYDLHTTKERLSISSTKRTYEFLKAVLKSFAEEMKNQRG